MPLFSIVIPTYNRGPFITAALASVFAQEFGDYEIIVVDDGSTDDTAERLEPYRDRIRLVYQNNLGPGAARNLGAKNSSGEYVAFLDSDDLWFPWTLATYAQAIRELGHPSIIVGDMVLFRNDFELSALESKPAALDVFADYFAASGRNFYCGSGQMVVLRKAFLEVGGFVEGRFNAEDHDLAMRLGTAPLFAYVTAPAMVAYRQHLDAVTRDLSKTVEGIGRLVRTEQIGGYPGGVARRRERWQILARHIRPVTLELLRQREYQEAWILYRKTLVWNLALGKCYYIAGFLGKAAQAAFISAYRRAFA